MLAFWSSLRQELREEGAPSASSIALSGQRIKAHQQCCLSATPDRDLLLVWGGHWPNRFAACSPSRSDLGM